MPVSGDPSPFSSSTTSNWVAQRGGLPPRVRAVARAIKRKNPSWDLSRCIAVAINTLKYSAATGDSRLPGVQREHGDVVQAHRAAIARWTAMKGHRGGRVAASHGSAPLVQRLTDGGRLVSRHLPDGTLELAHLDRHGFVLALTRHVRTEAGVRRYGLPIGSAIGGKPGDAVRELRLHHQGKTATIRRTADGKIERRNPDKTWRPATASEQKIFTHAEKRHDAEHAAIKAGGKPHRGADFVKAGEKARQARSEEGPKPSTDLAERIFALRPTRENGYQDPPSAMRALNDEDLRKFDGELDLLKARGDSRQIVSVMSADAKKEVGRRTTPKRPTRPPAAGAGSKPRASASIGKAPQHAGVATPKQVTYAMSLLSKRGHSTRYMGAEFKALGAGMRERNGTVENWLRNMSKVDISKLIDRLK